MLTPPRDELRRSVPARAVVARSLLLTLAALAAGGCTGPRGTLREARSRVERVRPEVELNDIRVETWRSGRTVEHWNMQSDENLSFPFVAKILAAQRPVFERLGLGKALDILIEKRLAADAPQVPAFVVPSAGLIVARPGAARSVQTLTHELAHIASWRLGYWRTPDPYLWLNEDRIGDPLWIDLDAFIAGWAVEEGAAELTALTAQSALRLPDEAKPYVELMVNASGNALSPRIRAPLVIRTQQFAYGNGLRYVAARGGEDPDLEARLAHAWQSFRGTSREILRPDLNSVPSRLAIALRSDLPALDPPPTSATRCGLFLLLEAISEQRGYDVTGLAPRVASYRDDVMLSWPGERHLWITEWSDPEAASEFAQQIESAVLPAAITVQGSRTNISWNAPPLAETWWLAAE